jgi:large subunit ribosomal protein L23
MNQQRLTRILISPHISEKTTRVADSSNQVVFRVRVDARKREIKEAVEKLFKVEVQSVSTANMLGKFKKFMGDVGRRPGWKKAYVRLKPGHDIDFLGGE